MHELEAWGGLDRTADGHYQVGMRIWELGQLAGRRLRDRAHPFLQDLFDLTPVSYTHLAEQAREQGVPAYIVFGDATLRGIAVTRPATLAERGGISGGGEKKLEQDGESLLEVVSAQ